MDITVNVEGPIDLNTVMGERYDPESDRRVPLTLADAIVDNAVRLLVTSPTKGWSSLQSQIESIRTELIRERVAAEIETALTSPFERTNHYGERTGKTTTLREEIVKLASEALKVDTRNSFSRELTAAQRVIRDEVDKAMVAELKAAVANEKEKVVAAVRAKAAELIADAVKQGVGR
ncbi:MAG TPA: hypothetical protein VF163_18155 [Micromonosporaceae bacterium]